MRRCFNMSNRDYSPKREVSTVSLESVFTSTVRCPGMDLVVGDRVMRPAESFTKDAGLLRFT